MTDPHIRIGIDIGGTFTDLQILNEATGSIASYKTPTTPDDPSVGLVTGIFGAAERFGFTPADIRLLVHGTTIATNAVLQRRLARGVLLTTAGFEDVLEIGRHGRRDIYGLKPHAEPPLIPRDRRLGLPERMRADGTAETALTEDAIAAIMPQLDALGAEAVAVCLLHAYVNPAHEEAVAAMIAARRPDLPVSISSAISPEIREYERCSTTVLNALLMPIVGGYMDRLSARLKEADIGARLLLVQSNGGVCTAELAKTQPARLLLSGPSGGALATLRTARAIGRDNVIGVDMGGTSYDVCVVADDRLTSITQGEIDSLPVRLPMVEIRTIGSGGGSIARVDEAGRLRVGPQSAGSQPGPVAYGRGGTLPTVTDANVVMKRLDPEFFLGGAMALDASGAADAIHREVAAPLSLGTEDAAEGLLTVTEANLAAAARLSLFEKGLDPRDFTLLSFGGAGGLHAARVAEALGIDEIVFPADASTFSAFGILYSDITHDLARSRVMMADEAALPFLTETLADLAAQADSLLDEDGVPAEDRRSAVSVDMRYRGQAFELVVPWDDPAGDGAALERLLASFHELHKQRFSYSDAAAPVELVAVRLSAIGVLKAPPASADAAPATAGDTRSRSVFTGGAWRDVAIHRREHVAGAVEGPALIEEEYTTSFIGEGWSCEPGPAGTLIARKTAR
ncbi:hydantoinase/oxoprolinase family protein [Acuticoccus sp. MNP-M23]|uniref:hydantoinase/oxoprolinase family protein n=1 Tax=Acuticoccus sp. MNP-M23 TaxID=3072793 RepID=UPI00281513E7|nr:hydantoinase/oxoprolinase family protein [Acuticoccus sp. MNP-M23]WMS42226.1 hydantoinase/oxoprolinase family protein [Acuticoccus sp. MNP-M23]